MQDFATTDLCDQHEALLDTGSLQVAESGFLHFGGKHRFCGPVTTLKLHEDNSLVRKALEQPGGGRVLVVDGGGSLRCALLGDQLAALAVSNQWCGVLVFGAIRDSRAMAAMDLGVLALATHPRKSLKRNSGEADVTVRFRGVTIRAGNWLYADDDGVLVSEQALT